jgi:hypothetical protein
MRNVAVGAVLALLVGCGGDSGGSSAPILAKVYLLDAQSNVMNGWPSGSKVMLDGEEIDLASVQLLSSPPPIVAVGLSDGASSLTIYVPGYGGFDGPYNADAGVTVQLIKQDLLNNLFVFTPTPGRVLVGDPNLPAGSRSMCVKGISKINASSALRFDVVLAVDRSASTSRDSGVNLDADPENETILEVQCESLRRYIDALRGTVKIAVMAFERDAVVYQTLTEDRDLAKAALDAIQASGSVGATSFVDVLEEAETLLTTDPNRTILTLTLENEAGEETETTVNAPRMVILCTDGIPTLPSGSGLTQELADRTATLDAARGVTDSQIIVNGVAFGPDAAVSKLTTLPGIAAITGGVYITSSDFLDLASNPALFGFADVTGVHVWNATVETEAAASFSPDGIFERPVPWTFGDNDIHVRLVTREAALSVETNFNVRVVRPVDSGVDAVIEAAPLVPLTDSNLRTPDGKSIGGSTLRQLFINGPTAVFDDLIELKGMETFQPMSSNPVMVQVVAKFSSFTSDFGFVEFDPYNPPANARALLSNGTAIRLANASEFSNTSKFEQYPPDGAATTFTTSMVPGKSYAFWAIPGGTLADYLANKPTKAPLFTVSMYNPISADHFLTYLSKNGRKGTTHGRVVVMCLEDTATIDQSDRDFNDLVFEIMVPPADFKPEFASPRCP